VSPSYKWATMCCPTDSSVTGGWSSPAHPSEAAQVLCALAQGLRPSAAGFGQSLRQPGLRIRSVLAVTISTRNDGGIMQHTWTAAQALHADLSAGRLFAPVATPAGLDLAPGERCWGRLSVVFARWFATEAVPQHYSYGAVGSPLFVAASMLCHSLAARRATRAAQQAAAPQWRAIQATQAAITDCSVRVWHHDVGRWLRFDHAALSSFAPYPQARHLVLQYTDVPAVYLGGPWAAWAAVMIAYRVWGQTGLLHAGLRPLASRTSAVVAP
jgi:hypothetical protein